MDAIYGQAHLFAIIKQEKKSGILTAPTVFVERLGLHAAVMLSQALYWTDRTKDVTGWFSKTHKEWARELRFSMWEVRQSLFVLRKNGLVETYTKALKKGTTTMIRVVLSKLTMWWNSHTPLCVIHTPPSVKSSQLINTETTGETTKTEITFADATGEPLSINEKQVKEITTEEDKVMAVKPSTKGVNPQGAAVVKKNVGAMLKAPISKVTKNKYASGQEIAEAYKKMYGRHIEFIGPLTQKDVGMLNHLVTRWREANVPHLEVLEYVIKNWISFIKKVELDKGLKGAPEKPTISFLVKYGSDAMAFWMGGQVTKGIMKQGTKMLHFGGEAILMPTAPKNEDGVGIAVNCTDANAHISKDKGVKVPVKEESYTMETILKWKKKLGVL